MTIGRAIGLLRAVAGSGAQGMKAGELASQTGIPRVTAHRILVQLANEGLIEQDSERNYHLGPEALFLGQVAAARFDIARIGKPVIEQVEKETQDTIYLLRRVPGAVLCIARCDGSYPIKSLVMDVGGRYPLGIGGAGLAVLAFLPQPEVSEALNEMGKDLAAYPRVTMTKVRQLLRDTKKLGYSYWPGLISEAHVIGVPISSSSGEPVGALSCAAIRERLEEPRRGRIVALLKKAARDIESQLPETRRLKEQK